MAINEGLVKFGNLLLCGGLFTLLVLADYVSDRFFVDFEGRAQIAKRMVHMGWLIFLAFCHLGFEFMVKEFKTWEQVPGRMKVSGVIYILISVSMLSDPFLVRLYNNDISDKAVAANTATFNYHAFFIGYVTSVALVVALACIQIALGFLNVGYVKKS